MSYFAFSPMASAPGISCRTPRNFDNLHRQFSKLTHTTFDKREFWRVVSRIGKRSRKPKPIFQTAPLGGLPQDLVDFLELQNPWWSGKPAKPTERFRRWAFGEVMHRLAKDLTPVVAVRGPRQVGKTTIQEQLIEQLIKLQGVRPARIFRVQFDEVPSLGFVQPADPRPSPMVRDKRRWWFDEFAWLRRASRCTCSSTKCKISRPGHRKSSPWWIMLRPRLW